MGRLTLKRGDIYVADVEPRSGSEQRGRRPVIVISNDGFNQTLSWRSIIIIPMSTSKRQLSRSPTAVPLPKGEAGLESAGFALCHQITTLDRAKFTRLIGSLSPEFLEKVETGLRKAIDI